MNASVKVRGDRDRGGRTSFGNGSLTTLVSREGLREAEVSTRGENTTIGEETYLGDESLLLGLDLDDLVLDGVLGDHLEDTNTIDQANLVPETDTGAIETNGFV